MAKPKEITISKIIILSSKETQHRITLVGRVLKRLHKALRHLRARSPETRCVTLFPTNDNWNVAFAAHSRLGQNNRSCNWRITMNLPMATLNYESNYADEDAIEKAWRFAVVWCSSWILGNNPATTMIDLDQPIY